MKKSKVLVFIVTVVCFLFSGYMVCADTGFDVDYNTGGSGTYGGGGSSNRYYDFDRKDRNLSGSTNVNTQLFLSLVMIGFLSLFLYEYFRVYKGKGKKEDKKNIIINDNSNVLKIWYDDVESIIPSFDKDEFGKRAIEMYLELQNAWMNFDYDKIRELTTDDLYNSYKSMLESLKKKNEINIIDDIKVLSCTFKNVKKQNDKYSIDASFELSFRDYIIKEGSSVISRGKNVKRLVTSVLTFVSTDGKFTNKCPSCGAELNSKSQSDKCKYCHSVIVKNKYDWVIAKKKNISQN